MKWFGSKDKDNVEQANKIIPERKKVKPKLGILTQEDSVRFWITENMKDHDVAVIDSRNYEKELPECQVLLCFELDDVVVSKLMIPIAEYALGHRVRVVWSAEGPEEWRRVVEADLSQKGAVIVPYTEDVDIPSLLPYLQDTTPSVKIEKNDNQQAKQEEVREVVTAATSIKSEEPIVSSVELKQESNIIAIAGYQGSGVSTLAFGLANFLKQPVVLVEGRKHRGGLARLYSRESWSDRKEQIFTLNEYLKEKKCRTLDSFPFIDFVLGGVGESIDLEAIKQLQQQKKWIIVDCGNDFTNPLFQAAGKKVFVTTPDPQCLFIKRPILAEIDVFILNRFPRELPIGVDEFGKMYGRKIDLVVHDQARNIFMSQWTRDSWVKRLSYEEAQQWMRAFKF